MLGWIFEHAGTWIPVIIIIAFVGAVGGYLLPILRSARALLKATRKLRVGADDEDVFARAPNYLRDLWEDYRQRRDGATVRLEGRIETTVAPEEIFTEHAVLAGYNRNVAGTLAGVFTGLGILGTFIGLVNGLSTVGTDPTQVLDSVWGVLRGMSTAFYTSIWGIFFSLVWLLLDRTMVHSVQRSAAHFFQAVKVRYPVASAEWFLHRLYEVEQAEHKSIERSEKLLEEQKAILQDLGTDLATAFEDALQNSFEQQFSPALQSVADSIEALQTQLGDRQVAAMNQLVETFQERLSEQLAGQFEHLSGALMNAAEWQERVHGELSRLLTRVQEAADGQRQVIERATAACDRYQDTLDQLSGSHELIVRSAESVRDTTAEITSRLAETAGSLTQELRTSIEMANTLTAEIGASVERIAREAAALETRIAELDSQQVAYREANEEIRTFLASQVDTMRELVESLTGYWSDFRTDLRSVGDGLKESVQEFSVFTAEKLREIFARFDGEMATIVEHLSGTLSEIREVNEDLPEGVERLRVTIDNALSPLANVNHTVGSVAESMQRLEELAAALRALEPLGGKLEQAAQQVSGANQSINRLGERLEVAIRRMDGADGNDGSVHAPLPEPR